MERVLVAGGTGLAGRAVVVEALRRGLSVRVLSRHIPAPGSEAQQAGAQYAYGDVCTGEGLTAALTDIDVVIDTLDATYLSARKRLPTGARNLTAAMGAAHVQRAVLLSIVNVDQCALSYYRAKTEQENIYAESTLQTVIVRATQFHDLVASMVSSVAKTRVFPAFRSVSFQPIAVDDVARALVDAALAPDVPDGGKLSIGGPEVISMRVLAALYRRSGRGRGLLVLLPLPGAFGRFLRAGRNLVPENAVGRIGFEEWLGGLDRKRRR